MGGGGSAGTVDFPQHMKEVHQDWLGYTSTGVDTAVNTDLIGVMNTALGSGGNPFESKSLTDPASDFTAVETELTEFDTAVDALNANTDWDSIVDNAIAKVDQSGTLNDIDFSSIVSAARSSAGSELNDAIQSAIEAIDDDIILRLVSDFQRRLGKTRRTAMNRFSAQMADINAVNSSAYFIGIALIESEFMGQVASFQAQAEGQLYNQALTQHIELYRTYLTTRLQSEIRDKASREQLLIQGIATTAQMFQNNTVLKGEVAKTLLEIKRLKTVAIQEYELGDIDIDYKFSKWDFDVFNNGANVLASIQGSAAVLPDQPSKTASALGGALSGAAAGAALGPVGALVGAGLGLGAGLLR